VATLTGRSLPRPGELLHFSEDPAVVRFEPHVAATARQPEAYVWAVDELNSPCYWFPRQCPRVCLWGDPAGSGEAPARVHAIEPEWVKAMSSTALYAYSFAADDFDRFGERPHAFVATHEVTPLRAPEPVGDLAAAHREHGIELRVVEDLHPFLDAGVARGFDFSAIRMRNSRRGDVS
jgi:hypothetical protein